MRIVATYPYVDAAGHLVHETVRRAPKSFSQRRPDPSRPGEYLHGLGTITPVLYHLPQVLAAIHCGATIYLCEGEKDADALQHALGVTTTTNAMGASAWRDTYTHTLWGASVVILPDCDKAGEAHALKVTSALLGTVARLKVVTTLHTEAPKSDVSDWLDAGGTRAAFEAAVAAVAWGTYPAPAPKPATPTRMPRPSAHDLYDRVEGALSYIPADERCLWLEIGMALHSTGETWARGLWETWSQGSEKYDAKGQERTWQSFKPGTITLGTLFYEAERHGWTPPRRATPVVPDMARPWHVTARPWTTTIPTRPSTEVPSWY